MNPLFIDLYLDEDVNVLLADTRTRTIALAVTT